MPRMQLKIPHHTNKQENYNLSERQSKIHWKEKEQESQDLWTIMKKKKNLTFIFRVLEGEEKGNADKKVFEKIMTKIFPVLAKSIKQHIQEFE